MNRLSVEQRVRVLAALVDGNSIRATVRMTGAAKGTILKLLAEVGTACAAYQSQTFVNLTCQRLQVDEIWAFVGSKNSNTPKEQRSKGKRGDVWTWTAIDAETKLIPSFYVGTRDADSGLAFMTDLQARLAHRVQLTSDGHSAYLGAVEKAFGWNGVDYAMLVKLYGQSAEGTRRYSPPVCIGATKEVIMGNPDARHISTSYAERANLTMRMNMRRFTRLTNAFSKKVENHRHAVALFTMHYNFCRSHTTLTKANKGVHVTPAMASSLADHVWSLSEIVGLLFDVPSAAA